MRVIQKVKAIFKLRGNQAREELVHCAVLTVSVEVFSHLQYSFLRSVDWQQGGENMDTPLQDCTIEEQRGIVRFLWAEGVKPVEIHCRNGCVVFSDVVHGIATHHVTKHNPKKLHYATLFFNGAILGTGVHVFALLAANRLKAERCSANG